MTNAVYAPPVAPLFSGDDGNRVIFKGATAIAANLATTDKVRLCKIPAGTEIDKVVIKNPDLDSGTTLAVNIGFEYEDGTSGPSATAVASAAATWQAAAETTYHLFPAVRLERDAYLVAVPTAAGVGTGTVYAKALGENLGVK